MPHTLPLNIAVDLFIRRDRCRAAPHPPAAAPGRSAWSGWVLNAPVSGQPLWGWNIFQHRFFCGMNLNLAIP